MIVEGKHENSCCLHSADGVICISRGQFRQFYKARRPVERHRWQATTGSQRGNHEGGESVLLVRRRSYAGPGSVSPVCQLLCFNRSGSLEISRPLRIKSDMSASVVEPIVNWNDDNSGMRSCTRAVVDHQESDPQSDPHDFVSNPLS